MAEPANQAVVPRPRRTLLERGAISIMVASGLLVGGVSSAWWFRDREAAREIAELKSDAEREKIVLARINDVERVHTERANAAAASSADNFSQLRLSMQMSTSQILAAIDKLGESVAHLKLDHDALELVAVTRDRLAAWAATLDTLNPELVVPPTER